MGKYLVSINGDRSRTKHTNQYESYIHSGSWRKRRQRALRLGHYRCALCGSTQSLQVHHLTYAQKRRKNYYIN